MVPVRCEGFPWRVAILVTIIANDVIRDWVPPTVMKGTEGPLHYDVAIIGDSQHRW